MIGNKWLALEESYAPISTNYPTMLTQNTMKANVNSNDIILGFQSQKPLPVGRLLQFYPFPWPFPLSLVHLKNTKSKGSPVYFRYVGELLLQRTLILSHRPAR